MKLLHAMRQKINIVSGAKWNEISSQAFAVAFKR